MPAWLGEDLFWGHRPLVVSLHDRKGEGSLWGLFCKNANPGHDGSTFMT